MMKISGTEMGLGTIMKLSNAITRSITAENVYGEKGKGGMADAGDKPQREVVRIGQFWDGPNVCSRHLGRKWKIRPCITIPAESTAVIMDVNGPGIIQHIWITCGEVVFRDLIIRIYWDGEKTPSVEAPLGDFFCNGWKKWVGILSLPINVNPAGGLNCYFPMPFRKRARITIENRSAENAAVFFYAINFAATRVEKDDAYFHAQFRRVNPGPYKQDYVILDGVQGKGHYVGTYLAWQQNSSGWWGEGEIKIFLDGDREFPSICGTGAEDYFGGAWGFGRNFSAPFLGYPYGKCDGEPGTRHGLYRFHIMDPIRFNREIKVTIQALGLQGDRYLTLEDDIASVAYWYQREPHVPFPQLPGRRQMEVSERFPWQSPFIASWQMSRMMPKGNGVANAPAVSLSKKMGWKPVKAWFGMANKGFVNIHPFFEMRDGIVYLATRVKTRQAGIWTLAVGHDGGVRVFVDGKALLTEPARINPALPDRSKADIEMKKGEHEIVVALDTDHGLGYGIFARFEKCKGDRDLRGKPEFPECSVVKGT